MSDIRNVRIINDKTIIIIRGVSGLININAIQFIDDCSNFINHIDLKPITNHNDSNKNENTNNKLEIKTKSSIDNDMITLDVSDQVIPNMKSQNEINNLWMSHNSNTFEETKNDDTTFENENNNSNNKKRNLNETSKDDMPSLKKRKLDNVPISQQTFADKLLAMQQKKEKENTEFKLNSNTLPTPDSLTALLTQSLKANVRT